MHHDTYMRLFWRHHEAEIEHLTGMREWLDNIKQRVGCIGCTVVEPPSLQI